MPDNEWTADLSEAQLDLDRQRRCGYPEVVFAAGKTVETLEKIVRRMMDEGVDVFATRVSPEQAQPLLPKFALARYNEVARTLRIPLTPGPVRPGSPQPSPARGERGTEIAGGSAPNRYVAIITAGTSDLPVAEEARETLDWMGVRTTLIQDVGVAGPHRLPARLAEFENAVAIVVVAGMEGALPSVVGGYVACPVIAVPTSVGYGANFGGLSALLSMLNSCAANVTVVNIDAGFKGGYVAGLIARGRSGFST